MKDIIEAETLLGKLVAYKNPDPENPGIIIDLKPEGKGSMPLAIIQYETKKEQLTAAFWPSARSVRSKDVLFDLVDNWTRKEEEKAHES